MKKIFTLFLSLMSFMAAMATEYTDTMTISVNEDSANMGYVTISVEENANGTYCLSIKNFQFGELSIGDVVADQLPATTDENGRKHIEVENWDATIGNEIFAAALGELKLNISATFNNEKLFAVIDLDLTAALGQIIKVTFGSKETFATIRSMMKSGKDSAAVYEVNGQQMQQTKCGQIYIVRQSDGTVKKIANK